MVTRIFYFSGTGNSLAVTRSIANELNGTEIVSIPKVIDGHTNTDAARIGLVFPVYAWGMPRIVAEFVKKLRLQPDQYVFAVATCGGTPGATLIHLQKILRKRGADLDAGFVVREAGHAPLTADNPLIRFVRNLDNKALPRSSQERLPEIVATVKNKEKHRPETSAWAANFAGSILHGAAIQTLQKADRDYWADEKCNFCRMCERICPRGNVTVENDKVSWHHNCELCFACLQWCPREAIQYKNAETKERSHHPEIMTKDVIMR